MGKKPAPVPVKIKRLLSAMSNGQRIVVTLRQSDSGDERLYCYEMTGKPVGPWTVNRAQEMGLIRPCGDGLFSDAASSQTLELAR